MSFSVYADLQVRKPRGHDTRRVWQSVQSSGRLAQLSTATTSRRKSNDVGTASHTPADAIRVWHVASTVDVQLISSCMHLTFVCYDLRTQQSNACGGWPVIAPSSHHLQLQVGCFALEHQSQAIFARCLQIMFVSRQNLACDPEGKL